MSAESSPASAPRILIAGCGDLGCTLAQQLLDDGGVVYGLRRSPGELPAGVQPLQGDVTQPSTLAGLATLAADFLVYAVAAGARSDEEYRAQYVDGLRNVLAALAPGTPLRHAFFVSSTRVYGQSGDTLLDENTPAMPGDFGGKRLREAEQLLDQAACPASTLRLTGLYGPGRTRLLELARHPQSWPQNTWSNRIHRDDAAAFITFLIRRSLRNAPLQPCYIVSDDAPAPLHEVLRWLAQQQDVDLEGIAPQPVAGGKRMSNAAMRQGGFSLRYPDYRSGYAELLARQR